MYLGWEAGAEEEEAENRANAFNAGHQTLAENVFLFLFCLVKPGDFLACFRVHYKNVGKADLDASALSIYMHELQEPIST